MIKKAKRKAHPGDSIIKVSGIEIGAKNFCVIAGPCSVESYEQIMYIARKVRDFGADILRGGAFKPRTSPYEFQGLRKEGIRLLELAKKETGLPVVSEIVSASDIEIFENIDILQVGSRNSQNYELLKELGKTDKPILLKRGMSQTLNEFILSAEYIMSGGNENVILCVRGIRTFSDYMRNTMDVDAIPMIKELTHLPVIADPSHATGLSKLVPSMAYAACAAGACGLEIEVHHDPQNALSDGRQALLPEEFERVIKKCRKIKELVDE